MRASLSNARGSVGGSTSLPRSPHPESPPGTLGILGLHHSSVPRTGRAGGRAGSGERWLVLREELPDEGPQLPEGKGFEENGSEPVVGRVKGGGHDMAGG